MRRVGVVELVEHDFMKICDLFFLAIIIAENAST